MARSSTVNIGYVIIECVIVRCRVGYEGVLRGSIARECSYGGLLDLIGCVDADTWVCLYLEMAIASGQMQRCPSFRILHVKRSLLEEQKLRTGWVDRVCERVFF